MQSVTQQLIELLKEIGDALPRIDHENIKNFVDYGEEVLAVDTLCEQLVERSCSLPADQRKRLMALVTLLGMDAEKYARILARVPG